MPHAIWTGTISFGLVTVPVRLVSATRSRDVRFNQLEQGTNARIRYRKVSDATGEEVPAERIEKGYDVGGGRYVVVTEDELRDLSPKASRTIEIEDFVDLDQIDPVYFEQPYYLVADPAAAKAYRLLVEAMVELRKVAIGRVVMRATERLVAIRPVDGALCLETMRYVDEVLPIPEIEGDAGEAPSAREIDMARQLVTTLATDFEPERYRDRYREEVLALIDRKAAGEEIVFTPAAEEPANVVDLMAALEASLAKARGAEPDEEPVEEKPARRRRARAG